MQVRQMSLHSQHTDIEAVHLRTAVTYAEVLQTVDERSLAHGFLAFSGGIAALFGWMNIAVARYRSQSDNIVKASTSNEQRIENEGKRSTQHQLP